jgi:deoxyribodipyrimidine photolyase-related protein
VNTATFIFPNQLFKDHPALKQGREVFLIEDDLFFTQYKFHKQKLVLHRASMKYYENYLCSFGYHVNYIEASSTNSIKNTFEQLRLKDIQEVHLVETVDYLLERRLKRYASTSTISCVFYDSPNFLCTQEYLTGYFKDKKRYYLTEFYIAQRKRLNILTENEKPVGDKWTFDTENRKKLPATVAVPSLPNTNQNHFVADAIDYVQTNFRDNYGSLEYFIYPTNHEDAEANLTAFLEQRFSNYGIYQDAIVKNNSFLFHSLLTPALNIGLLSPADIIDQTLAYAAKNNIPLNSLEGFVRQIIGWREFVRAVYVREGVKERTANHWEHTRKIPECFWTATTGIEPLDNVIQKVLTTGYCNHIERLMVMGNFMLLCEFDPNEVYQWFMELFIDAYDWVMVPNVYGMSQFADGGLMSTKPYISGSNYILKMSDFKKGTWCEVWDALYWCFIDKHKVEFNKNPRMNMMVRQLEKMDATRLSHLKEVKEHFLLNLK